jgi:hypothetical protein
MVSVFLLEKNKTVFTGGFERLFVASFSQPFLHSRLTAFSMTPYSSKRINIVFQPCADDFINRRAAQKP